MSLRQCKVCGKEVREGDETEHLRTNHLGPHYFYPFQWMAKLAFPIEQLTKDGPRR